jgi:hypothetical protein
MLTLFPYLWHSLPIETTQGDAKPNVIDLQQLTMNFQPCKETKALKRLPKEGSSRPRVEKESDPEPKKAKGRYTVALSEKSEKILEELKDFSDAETTTEVIRDALRLSYAVMVAQKEGLRLELCDPKKPEDRKVLAGFSQLLPA